MLMFSPAFLVFLLCSVFAFIPNEAPSPVEPESYQQLDAKSIVEKADKRARGETSIAEISIDIIRPTWTRTMKIKTWSKGNTYAMILVTAPVKDKGTVFLKRDKEVWNWLPSIERNIKLPPSMMSQSWMGTDFTNDDLVKESSVIHDYSHEIVGDSIIDGRSCWKIELTPLPEAPVVWGRILTWIDKKDYIQMRVEFMDEDLERVSTMVCKDIRMVGGRLLPTTMEMTPADKPGHKTVFRYESLVFDSPLPESFFTTLNMPKVQ